MQRPGVSSTAVFSRAVLYLQAGSKQPEAFRAHPHLKELACPCVKHTVPTSMVGKLSRQTQRSPVQPGLACLLYLGVVTHTAARVHFTVLSFYGASVSTGSRAPSHMLLGHTSQGNLQTDPRSEALPEGTAPAGYSIPAKDICSAPGSG